MDDKNTHAKDKTSSRMKRHIYTEEEVTKINVINISNMLLTHWIFDNVIIIRNIPCINWFLEWPSISMIVHWLLRKINPIIRTNFSTMCSHAYFDLPRIMIYSYALVEFSELNEWKLKSRWRISKQLAFRSDRINPDKCFWFVALSVETFKLLNREWPHWSRVHPASPVITFSDST